MLTAFAAAPDAGIAPWAASAVDLVAIAVLLGWAWWRARSVSFGLLLPLWIGAAFLGVHALLAGLGSPEISATVAGGLMVIGLALALAARGQQITARCVPGAIGLGLAVTQAPLLVASIAEAADAPSRTVFHSAIVTIAVLPAIMLLVRRFSGSFQLATLLGYGVVALATVPMSLVYGVESGGDPNPIYLAIGGLGAAVAVALARDERRRSHAATTALLILPVITVLATIGTIVAVFVAPLSWLGEIWTGMVGGSGLSPLDDNRMPVPRTADAVAITIMVATLGLIIFNATGRLRPALRLLARLAGIPLLVWLAVVQAPWPTVPLVTLVGGLTLVVVTLLRRAVPADGGSVALALAGLVTGAVQIVSGFTGLLPEKWSTITAFALVTVAFALVAAARRATEVTVVGALVAGPAWIGFALSCALAADLRPRYVGLIVLAAAAVLLFIATANLPATASPGMPGGVDPVRPSDEASGSLAPSAVDVPQATESGPALAASNAETVAAQTGVSAEVAGSTVAAASARRFAGLAALEPVAHLTALVMLFAALGSARRVAEVCLLWGVAVGLTALWSQARLARTIAAGVIETVAWWSMLVATDVTVLEAYTVPVAVAGLVIGFFALRKRPELSSWIGYGPALVAAFGPSTVAMLPLDSSPWRRLLLGVFALVAVVAGAVRRRQAPFVVGAVVLVLLALHEIFVGWDLLPRWAWFALGGALLVGLGITYERRRRDIARLKEKISAMR